MSCRLHCRHQKTGFEFYLEYADWAVALADAKRLSEAGFVGVPNGSAPAAREPGARQREAQVLEVLHHLQAQCAQAAEREGRLLQLLEEMQRQQHLALEREARLLQILERPRSPRLLEAPRRSPRAGAATEIPPRGLPA